MLRSLSMLLLLGLVACDTTGDVRPHCAAVTSSAGAKEECLEAYSSGDVWYTRKYQVKPGHYD